MNTRRSEAADLAAVQRRTMRVLVAAQIVSGAGLAADVTVGALLAQDTVAAVIIPALLTARNR